MSGNVKKFVKKKGYESLSRDMLQDVDNLSIEAIGLLSHLTSYPESWKLYKTELYTRFKKSKRTKISNAWDELVEEKYIVQLRKRVERKYEYIYYHSQERFTDEDIKEIMKLENAELWDGKMRKKNDPKVKKKKEDKQKEKEAPEEKKEEEKPNNDKDFSTVDFQQSNFNSSKSTPNKLTREEINYKEININNLNLNLMDELWKLDLPMILKQRIKSKIIEKNINITYEQLIDLEHAYRYQIEKGTVVPNAAEDQDGLNEKEFADTIMKMFSSVKNIVSMRAMVDTWVTNGFNYKFDKIRSLIHS